MNKLQNTDKQFFPLSANNINVVQKDWTVFTLSFKIVAYAVLLSFEPAILWLPFINELYLFETCFVSFQRVFTLSEKSWSGSCLQYKWQKTVGNYLAAAGWVPFSGLYRQEVFIFLGNVWVKYFIYPQPWQFCKNLWSTWTEGQWVKSPWVSVHSGMLCLRL